MLMSLGGVIWLSSEVTGLVGSKWHGSLAFLGHLSLLVALVILLFGPWGRRSLRWVEVQAQGNDCQIWYGESYGFWGAATRPRLVETVPFEGVILEWVGKRLHLNLDTRSLGLSFDAAQSLPLSQWLRTNGSVREVNPG